MPNLKNSAKKWQTAKPNNLLLSFFYNFKFDTFSILKCQLATVPMQRSENPPVKITMRLCFSASLTCRGVDPDNKMMYCTSLYAVHEYQTSKAGVIIESNFGGLRCFSLSL